MTTLPYSSTNELYWDLRVGMPLRVWNRPGHVGYIVQKGTGFSIEYAQSTVTQKSRFRGGAKNWARGKRKEKILITQTVAQRPPPLTWLQHDHDCGTSFIKLCQLWKKYQNFSLTLRSSFLIKFSRFQLKESQSFLIYPFKKTVYMLLPWVLQYIYTFTRLNTKPYNLRRITRKELSLYHKLWFSNTYIFATWWCKPLIFQIQII